MILTASEIRREREKGTIVISPYVDENVGPNSYDVTLSDVLVTYADPELDMAVLNPTEHHVIPADGMMLYPGELYLGATVERVGSAHYVPMLEGRSSVGRLGLACHITAGFGDLAFLGTWTLEMTVVKPVRVYAGVRIGQVFFHTVDHKHATQKYKGKYTSQTIPRPSEMWRDKELRERGPR